MTELKFSIIIPVFNRPQEIGELLQSLLEQDFQNFEVIVVEDGSDLDCKDKIAHYTDRLDIKYFYKQNSGPGDSRNFGVTKATGNYLIFFDSDCLIPPDYLRIVQRHLSDHWLDAYGGPDRAHKNFSTTQKAINYSMTSFLTTGGIRGHGKDSEDFQPRSFNMGVNRRAFNSVGGFSNIHPGEDPDLIYRLSDKGYTKGLIPNASVYHKRRINLNKFSKQVYKFGLARTILMKWHPKSKKWIFGFPTIMMMIMIILLAAGFLNEIYWYLLLSGFLVVFLDSVNKTRNLRIAILGLVASIVQVISYGWGFLTGWWHLHLLGKQETRQFPELFLGPET